MTDAKNVKVFAKRNANTGKQKRSNHVDFMTSEEHKKNKTTGVRKNDMSLEYEFWILGEIVRRVSFVELQLNPEKLEEVHAELFAFK